MSGYADMSAMGEVDAAAIVPKPFTEETLAGLVSETLAALRRSNPDPSDELDLTQSDGTTAHTPARQV